MKKYLMNEVMDMLQVTRGMLKYYESKQIICPDRSENGYRLYDELMISKIAFIVSMRNLGFSHESIEKMFDKSNPDIVKQECARQYGEYQQQIIEIQEKMNEIESIQQLENDFRFYFEHYKICEHIMICPSCQGRLEKQNIYYCMNTLMIFEINNNYEVKIAGQCENAIFKTERYPYDTCIGCDHKETIQLEKAFRVVVPYREEEDLKKKIREGYQIGRSLGYLLEHTIYCMKRYCVLYDTSSEGFLVDIFIPFKKE